MSDRRGSLVSNQARAIDATVYTEGDSRHQKGILFSDNIYNIAMACIIEARQEIHSLGYDTIRKIIIKRFFTYQYPLRECRA